MLTLEQRIKYWRGRQRLANSVGLKDEAEQAARLVAALREARRVQVRSDKVIDRIAAEIPSEEYE